MKKQNLKRIGLILSLAAVISVGGSLAYFTDTDTKTNVLTLGKVDGELVETTTETNTSTSSDGGIIYNDPVMPGDVLSKQPDLVLTEDSEDAYARVSIAISGTNSDGTALSAGQQAELEKVTLDINNDEGWYKGTDGYYYYNTKLTNDTLATRTTAKVFNHVYIPGSWDNDMRNVTVSIKIVGQMIQADNFEGQLQHTDSHISSWGSVDI